MSDELRRELRINEETYHLAVNQYGAGAPTASTPGKLAVLYMDTDTGDLYKCTAADVAAASYTWEPLVGNDSGQNPTDNLVTTSPDGTKWRITVTNEGTVTAEKVGGTDTEEIPATSIVLSANALSFADSASKTLTATVAPSNSTDAVAWTSSAPEIAKVSNLGVVTPIGNGSCTITATAGSVSARCEVTVAIESGEAVTYSITRNITNATGFDDSVVIGAGSELLECYISNDECTMDGATATVTMGGVDITETAWDNGVVNIAEVTGDVVITLDAVRIQYVEPPVEDFTVSVYNVSGVNHLHITAYVGEDTAIAIPTSMTYEGNTYTVADNTLNLYYFDCGNIVEHIKIPDGMTRWKSSGVYITPANFEASNKTALRTVSGVTQGSCKNSSNIEKVQDIDNVTTTEIKEYYVGVTNIRTLENVAYPDIVTSLNATYQNCTGLVSGGVIPAHITTLTRAFYGCKNLRRIRVETVAEGTSASGGAYFQTFYDVSKLDIELYLSSGLWSCLRGSANLNWNYTFIDGAVHNRIIIIGDSLTGGTYGSYLRNLVPINATVNESAQGGWTSQQIYEGKMMVDPVKMRLPESIVVIWHGTNGYGPDGYDGVTAKMVAALEGNQRYLLIPPTAQGEGDEVYESWKATYGEEHVLSMGDWFANNGYTVPDYQTDGTHFNADGYALIAQAVHEKIQHWL